MMQVIARFKNSIINLPVLCALISLPKRLKSGKKSEEIEECKLGRFLTLDNYHWQSKTMLSCDFALW
jgi:hypothetical protein